MVGEGGARAGKRGTTQPGDAMQPLTMELRRRMRSKDPWDLLGLLTTIVNVSHADAASGEQTVPLGAFVESLVGVDLAETTAALERPASSRGRS